MFDYVIALLSSEFAAKICDFIPAKTPYDILKEQLIKRTAASEQRHLQQFFSAEALGDCKPTKLLRCLQQLAGDTPGADGALQRLPNGPGIYTRQHAHQRACIVAEFLSAV